ncbi:hypothetical protein ACHAXA_000414 [Cyclostephanos tholiformis]|uniref:Uncharacterized protein n=1 Tax=Cyclostephanos tholiformis TaxID=382380 RepID=A0ABD3RES2_9STRA
MESSVNDPSHHAGLIACTLFLGAASLFFLFKGGANGVDCGGSAVAAAAAARRKVGSRRRQPPDDNHEDDRGGRGARSTTTTTTTKSGDDVGRSRDHSAPPLRSVFSVKQPPARVMTGSKGNVMVGGGDGSSSSSTSSSSSRPFESAYYFAHNGQSTG